MPPSLPYKLFIIYAHEDQSELLELKAHLRPLEKRGDLTVWYDGEILPGEKWDHAIKAQLQAADIVLLFISKYFFNSEYIEREELKMAFERHRKSEIIVVPVIVKPCMWDVHSEISALQVLPKDGKAVSSWKDPDEAFLDIARGVEKLTSGLKNQLPEAHNINLIAQKVEKALEAYDSGQYSLAFEQLLKYAATEYSINPRGYNILGKIYNSGDGGVEINHIEALKWYFKGAKGGYANSFANIGFMHQYGQGIEKDYAEALKWNRIAAEKGSPYGQNNLGIMFEFGQGVVKDLSIAVKWYRQAALQGLEYAKANLKRLGYSE